MREVKNEGSYRIPKREHTHTCTHYTHLLHNGTRVSVEDTVLLLTYLRTRDLVTKCIKTEACP